MSYADRKKVSRYLTFFKEKRDGKTRARGCADGRPQRIYINKRQQVHLQHQ